jgi:hypothetical protein
MKEHIGKPGQEPSKMPEEAPVEPVEDEISPFVGRMKGTIQASREDLLAPIGEDWEVDQDL